MSDFLSHLIDRTVSPHWGLQPRFPSRFEPNQASLDSPASLESVPLEIEMDEELDNSIAADVEANVVDTVIERQTIFPPNLERKDNPSRAKILSNDGSSQEILAPRIPQALPLQTDPLPKTPPQNEHLITDQNRSRLNQAEERIPSTEGVEAPRRVLPQDISSPSSLEPDTRMLPTQPLESEDFHPSQSISNPLDAHSRATNRRLVPQKPRHGVPQSTNVARNPSEQRLPSSNSRHDASQTSPDNIRESSPPTIRVTIGRIDVRGGSNQPSTNHVAARPQASSQRLSLEEYLKQRQGGTP